MSLFVVRARPVDIDAPADLVWEVLSDVDRYGEWNSFSPEVRTDFTIGSPAEVVIAMGRRRVRVSATIRAFDPPRHIAWGGTLAPPRWFFSFVREQHLEAVGTNRCRYHNVEHLAGACGPLIFFFLGGMIRRNYTAVAMELKRRAEAKYAGD